MKYTLALSMFVGLVLCMTAPAAFAESSSSSIPFRATGALVSSTGFVAREPCGPVAGGGFGRTDIYEGTATALGRFTLTENLCVNLRQFDPVSNPSIPYATWSTFTAANGDQLSYLEAGYLNTALGTSIPISFQWFVYGSTGRFAHPSGSLATTYIVNREGDSLGLTVVGELAFTASDRSQ